MGTFYIHVDYPNSGRSDKVEVNADTPERARAIFATQMREAGVGRHIVKKIKAKHEQQDA